MKFRIDFSLFYSPTQPYGNVKGYIEAPSHAQPGDVILLLDDGAVDEHLALRVDSTLKSGDDHIVTLMLEDHLVDGHSAAEALAHMLEADDRFFVDVYEG